MQVTDKDRIAICKFMETVVYGVIQGTTNTHSAHIPTNQIEEYIAKGYSIHWPSNNWEYIMDVIGRIEETTDGDQGYKYQVVIQNNHCRIERADIVSSDGYVYGDNKKDAVVKAIVKWLNRRKSQ